MSQLRPCPCRAHAASSLAVNPCAGSSVPPADAPTIYVAPTRALLLQLSRFPVRTLRLLQVPHSCADAEAQRVQSRYPHLTTLLQRSTSMRLHWAQPTSSNNGPAAAIAEESEQSSCVALRLLGLSSAEHAAAAHRAQLLEEARRQSGVLASPAASYPPVFGAPGVARFELATNHRPLLALCAARRAAMQAEAARHPQTAPPVAHCNEPRFLAAQEEGAAPDAAAPLPLHASQAPLDGPAALHPFIERTVLHVATRLGLRMRSDLAAGAQSSKPQPPAHVLLLHLDAMSLLGPAPADADARAAYEDRSLACVDRMLAALAAQLHSAPAPLAQAQPSASYPPPAPMVPARAPASHAFWCDDAPSSPLSAAASLLAPSRLCPDVLWSLLLEHDDSPAATPPAAVVAPSVDACASLRSELLLSLRPVQSYRVQEGCVAPSDTRWATVSAFIYHHETTRIGSSSSSDEATPGSHATFDAALPAPLHGSLHVMQFVREMIFKLGLGSKYGA